MLVRRGTLEIAVAGLLFTAALPACIRTLCRISSATRRFESPMLLLWSPQ